MEVQGNEYDAYPSPMKTGEEVDYVAMVQGGKEWRERNPDYKPNVNAEEALQKKVDAYNALKGELPLVDCPACKNKGRIAVIDGNSMRIKECECMVRRSNRDKMERAGLGGLMEKCKFANYMRTETFQESMYQMAYNYAKAPDGWLLLSGAPGCGKTHLCTAVCTYILKDNPSMSFHYMKWADESKQLKASITEKDDYERQIRPLKKCGLLYIDDFLKCRRGEEPTTGDINLAFEIINSRLIQSKITIISTEWNIDHIVDFDEALGSRIYEAVGPNKWYVKRGDNTNYRMRNR